MPPKRIDQQKNAETEMSDNADSHSLEKQLREREIDEKMKIASEKNQRLSRRHKEVAEDKKQAEARQQAVNMSINVSQIRYRDDEGERTKGQISGRGRGRGRGRGQPNDRGRSRGEGFRRSYDRFKKGNSEDDKWRTDREEIDKARIDRQKTEKGDWKREWDCDKQINDPQPPTPKQTVPHRPDIENRETESRNREFEGRHRGRGSYNNRPKSTHFETFKNFKITTDQSGRQVERAEEIGEFTLSPTQKEDLDKGRGGSGNRRQQIGEFTPNPTQKEDFDKGRGGSGNRRQQHDRFHRGSPRHRPESGEARTNIGQWGERGKGRGRVRGRGRGGGERGGRGERENRYRGQRRRPFPNIDNVNAADKNPDDEYHEDNYLDDQGSYYESGPKGGKKNRAVTDSTDSLHRFIEENTLKVNKDGELLDSNSLSTETSPKSLILTTPTLVSDWGAEMEKQEVGEYMDPYAETADNVADEMADEDADEIADEIADKTADALADEIADKKADKIADATADEIVDKEADKITDAIEDKVPDALADKMENRKADKVVDAITNETANAMANAGADQETTTVSDGADVTIDTATVEATVTNSAVEKTDASIETGTDDKPDVKENISGEKTCLTEDNKTSIPSDTILEKTTDKISDSSAETKANNTSEESREEAKSPIDNSAVGDIAQKAESEVILKDEKANESQIIEESEKTTIGNSVSNDDMYKIAYTDSC